MAAIEKVLPEAGLESLEGVECLILGAGGAARSIAIGAKDRGAKITISNRTDERGKCLAAELGVNFIHWEEREDSGCTVLINATSVGMHPDVDISPMSTRVLERSGLVFDAVYNPPLTSLLQYACDAGVPTASGVDMFVHQAVMQFELWTGGSAPAGLMREKILSRLTA